MRFMHHDAKRIDWPADVIGSRTYIRITFISAAIINRRATMGRCTPRDASRWRSLTGSTWSVTRIKIYFTLNWVTPRAPRATYTAPVIVRVIIRLEVRSSTYLMQVATQNEMTIAWHGKRIQFLWTPHFDRLFLILYGTSRFQLSFTFASPLKTIVAICKACAVAKAIVTSTGFLIFPYGTSLGTDMCVRCCASIGHLRTMSNCSFYYVFLIVRGVQM